jgi:hypothetical protein
LNDSGGGSLSPDGSLLMFVGGGSFEWGHCGPCHLVANADGTEMRVFLPYCDWDPAGTWSPDGSRIVCSKGDAIIVVDIASGDVSRVAEGSGAIWVDRHALLVEGSARPTSASSGPTEHPPSHTLSRIVEGVAFSFRVRTWEGWAPGPIKHVPDGSGLRTGRLLTSKSIMGPQGAEAVVFWTSFPSGDRADPCANLLSRPVGPSAADLAGAVATAPGTELVKGPSDVTVGGYPAKHVVLTVREDLGCDPGFFFHWHAECWGPCWMETNVGGTIRVWIIDVDETRLFIEAETTMQADSALKHEIQQIVRSIRFD